MVKAIWPASFTASDDMGMKASVLTGIPLLLVSLILGTQWAIIHWMIWSIFDLKIIGSFFLARDLWVSIVFTTKW